VEVVVAYLKLSLKSQHCLRDCKPGTNLWVAGRGRSRFENRTYMNKAVALVAGSEGRGACNAK
jgi:hypothetical protein